MMTLVVVICHMIVGITAPICHEEIVAKEEMSLMGCQIGNQQIVADWKEKSVFQGENWHIAVIRCESGDYQMKDDI